MAARSFRSRTSALQLLLSNIFVPQVGVRLDELAHQRDALCIVDYDDFDSPLLEEVFRSREVSILADDHARNAVEKGRPRTHDAGAERADQCQLRPIAPAAGVPQADHLGVSSGVPS